MEKQLKKTKHLRDFQMHLNILFLEYGILLCLAEFTFQQAKKTMLLLHAGVPFWLAEQTKTNTVKTVDI